jgi:multicomponent Na+:H+ antiporter subunit D
MDTTAAVLAALLVPLAGAVLIALCVRRPNLREGMTIATAALLLYCVASLLPAVRAGAQPALALIEVMPGLRSRRASSRWDALRAVASACGS